LTLAVRSGWMSKVATRWLSNHDRKWLSNSGGSALLAPVVVRVVRVQSLEAAMNPQVLLGHATHMRLDIGVEAPCVFDGVVTGEVLQRRVDDHPVTAITG